MKMHGKVSGAAWAPSLLAIVVLALLVLVIFGATPSALLQIPQDAFNAMKAPAATAQQGASGPGAPASAAASPSPASSAAPTPAPFDLKALGNSPAEWPKLVALKEATDFPSFGKANRAPAGAMVKLISIMGTNLSVEFNGSAAIVPADSTDLKERVMAARARAGGY